jgi:hypothetical protein
MIVLDMVEDMMQIKLTFEYQLEPLLMKVDIHSFDKGKNMLK